MKPLTVQVYKSNAHLMDEERFVVAMRLADIEQMTGKLVTGDKVEIHITKVPTKET